MAATYLNLRRIGNQLPTQGPLSSRGEEVPESPGAQSGFARRGGVLCGVQMRRRRWDLGADHSGLYEGVFHKDKNIVTNRLNEPIRRRLERRFARGTSSPAAFERASALSPILSKAKRKSAVAGRCALWASKMSGRVQTDDLAIWDQRFRNDPGTCGSFTASFSADNEFTEASKLDDVPCGFICGYPVKVRVWPGERRAAQKLTVCVLRTWADTVSTPTRRLRAATPSTSPSVALATSGASRSATASARRASLPSGAAGWDLSCGQMAFRP
eukprot:scaffold453_cov243-Pinguiococcus_pyrenoidosus.AAC.9